ncbi:Hypothetical predicted protein [Cloeon dipterum]|uniref:Gustatory receptor n=1 Tax=Cloeon dipterum TaxID=197152 RepID=A0A8S1CQ17_9INSE|nr:Hypothetical predicted protein [Cloeon dipterum]
MATIYWMNGKALVVLFYHSIQLLFYEINLQIDQVHQSSCASISFLQNAGEYFENLKQCHNDHISDENVTLVASTTFINATIFYAEHVCFCCKAVNSVREGYKTPIPLLKLELDFTRNKIILEECQLFREELMHYKNYSFSLCGMSNIDYQFIVTISAAVVAYLVTIIQFQLVVTSLKTP